MLKDYSKKLRPSRFDSVSWEDFEEVCKDYDADILHLTEEIKGLKEMFEITFLIIYRQSGTKLSFEEWLDETYKDLESLEDKIN